MKLWDSSVLQYNFNDGARGVPEDIVLYDLSEASTHEIAMVAGLAWNIKELFFDIQSGGAAVLYQRLALAFDHTLDQPTLNRLISSLPRDTLINNQKEWFPRLAGEVFNFRQNNRKIPKHDMSSELENDERIESVSHSYVGELEINTGDDDEDILDEDILDEDILDEDILDEDILDEDILEAELDDEGILGGDEEFDDISEADDENVAVVNDIADINAQNSEDWAKSGGWYREGSNILYRPIDHADPFLATWLEVTFGRDEAVHNEIFESLSGEQSVGGCIKCHSLTTIESERQSQKIHWQGFKPEDIRTDFNRFSHVSHFSLMTDDGCSSCHILNEVQLEDVQRPEETTSDANSEPVYETSFLSMTRSTCTQCHQQGRAPSNCLTCHQYHATRQGRPVDQIADKLSTESPL
ncbi:hypothetical protein A9Q81_15275 [Gammaproteobacteria bacterium 42_54_T18]|nr:hypothetical protein A9Q81_15275 [Gammaproteobacteria bacterium 42_54_T18]